MSIARQEQIRVLHVDDDPSLTDLTATFLEREDDRLTVETANSVDEGLRLLANSEIDCIVSDYQMPGTNGIEFLEIVAEEHPNLPFILYTGKGSEEVASEAISAGVTDYLQKETGTDDYALLTNRIVHAVDSQQRKRRVQFLQTLANELTEVSIDFLRTEKQGTDALIERTLRKIGTLVNADRTYVFDVDHEADTFSNTHEWCSEGVEPQIDMLQDIPQDTLPWWTQKLKGLERIIIPNVSALPPEAEAEQEILQEQNIESLVVTPMISDDELVGFIGFDWVDEQEAWSDEFIQILRMVSELITTARKRKEREQELQELKSQYETLAESFPDGAVFLIDADLRYVRAGGEELSKVGLSPDGVEGAKPHALFPGEIVDEVCHYYEQALAGNPNTFEQAYRGERYRVQTVPVRTDGNEIDHVMAVSQNITERTRDKRELERQNERLSEFVSIVSHDLRSPLRVVEGNLELAQETCESDHLTEATDALDRSQALIDDLLELARGGKAVGELEPVDLADVAERSWQTVETESATFELHARHTLKADRSRLQQLLENLYRNAVEHGDDDVTVAVGTMDDGFHVADTGPGVPESDRKEIFEAGYSTAEDGTGFGLRIVERIIDAHGWEITVTESEQGGARFEITGVEFADR